MALKRLNLGLQQATRPRGSFDAKLLRWHDRPNGFGEGRGVLAMRTSGRESMTLAAYFGKERHSC